MTLNLNDDEVLEFFPGPTKVEIRFTCDAKKSSSAVVEPVLSYQASGTYIFNVPTPLGCGLTAVDCHAFDREGNKYDLWPLARTTDPWVVTNGTTKYYFNVCRSVNLAFNGTNCLGIYYL